MYKLGLVFNLIGSIFLGLQILGEKRLLKLESYITDLPKKISVLIIKIATSKFLLYKSKRSYKAQKLFKKLNKEVRKKGHSSENTAKEFLFDYLLPGIFIGGVIWAAISPFIIFLFLAVKPLQFVQEKLKIESFFGLLGMMLLFLGFLFQFLA